MATRSELYAAINDWLPHPDYTDGLRAQFVRLAEAEINRQLRAPAMEKTDESFALVGRATPLPSDLIALRSVSANQANARNMDFMPPELLRSSLVWDASGRPLAYTIEGTSLVVAPVPAAGTDVTLVYWSRLPTLVGTPDDPNATNWALDNAFDVYLFGCLSYAAAWQGDVQAAETAYWQRFMGALENANTAMRWAHRSGSSRMRFPASNP